MAKETPSQDEEEQPAAKRPATSSGAGPTFAEPEQPVSDLSNEIARTIPRSAGEHVTCRRITGDHYRCNWWKAQKPADHDNGIMSGLAVTTQRVSKSEFLHVTRTAGGLSFRPLPGVAISTLDNRA